MLNVHKNKLLLATAFIIIAFLIFITYIYFQNSSKNTDNDQAPETNSINSSNDTENELPDAINIQPDIEEWLANQPGTYSIIVYDPILKTTVASHAADNTYFAASIYKLYVAYAGLLNIQNGNSDPNQIYINNWNRLQCIQEMVRTSNSPCAEKMLNEIGHTAINNLLTEYGLKDTSFPGFLTSARDTNTILKRLHEHLDLTEENTNILLEAMLNQTYRQSSVAGMPKANVAIKVGLYETGWHDVGFITMPNERVFIYNVLSKDAFSEQVKELATVIYDSLNK